MGNGETLTLDADPEKALGMSLRITMGEGRELVFQTHVPQSVSLEKIDALVDKLHTVAQRQIAVTEIEFLQRENVDNTRKAMQIMNDKADLLAKEELAWNMSETRRGPWDVGKLPAQTKQAVNNHDVSMSRYKQRIDANKERIAELEQWLTQRHKS